MIFVLTILKRFRVDCSIRENDFRVESVIRGNDFCLAQTESKQKYLNFEYLGQIEFVCKKISRFMHLGP
jgi:hypothetical protein